MFQRMVLFLFAFAALGQEISVNHTVFLKKGWTAVWVASQYSLNSDDFRFYTYRHPVGHPKAGQIIPVNDPKTGKVTRAQLAAFRDLAVDTQIDIPTKYRRTAMYKPAKGETLASVCASKISGSNCVPQLSKINRVKSPTMELLSEITVPTTFRIAPVQDKKSGDKGDDKKKKTGNDPVPSQWDKFVKSVRLRAGSLVAALFSKVANIPDRYWFIGLGLLMAAVVLSAASRGTDFSFPRFPALPRPKWSLRSVLKRPSFLRWPNIRWRPKFSIPKIPIPGFLVRRMQRRASMEYHNYEPLLQYAGRPDQQVNIAHFVRCLHPAAVIDFICGISLWSVRIPPEVKKFSEGFIERAKFPLGPGSDSDMFVVTRFNWWHRRIVIRVWGKGSNPFPNMLDHKHNVNQLWERVTEDLDDDRFKPQSYRAITSRMWRRPGVDRGKQGVEFVYTFRKQRG